jgi:hypothetical protein
LRQYIGLGTRKRRIQQTEKDSRNGSLIIASASTRYGADF